MLPSNRTIYRRLWLTLAGGLLLFALLAGCGKKNNAEVATYNGGSVTSAELESFLGADKFFNYNAYYDFIASSPSFKEQMLKQLIAFKAIAAGVDQAKQDKAAKGAKEQIDLLNQSVKDNKELKKQLDEFFKEHKIDKEDLQDYLTLRFTVSEYLNAQVTEDKMKAEYDQTVAEDKHYFDTAKVSHILIGLKDQEGKEIRSKEEAQKRALEVRDKILAGGDFAELAKEYSDDPGTKENGGSLEIQLGKNAPWAPEFKQAAIDLEVNEISEPVLTEYGYHVIRVDEKQLKSYEDVKEQVRGAVVNNLFNEYMEKEFPKLNAKINLPKEETGDETGGKTEDNEGEGKTDQSETDQNEKDQSEQDQGESQQ